MVKNRKHPPLMAACGLRRTLPPIIQTSRAASKAGSPLWRASTRKILTSLHCRRWMTSCVSSTATTLCNRGPFNGAARHGVGFRSQMVSSGKVARMTTGSAFDHVNGEGGKPSRCQSNANPDGSDSKGEIADGR